MFDIEEQTRTAHRMAYSGVKKSLSSAVKHAVRRISPVLSLKVVHLGGIDCIEYLKTAETI